MFESTQALVSAVFTFIAVAISAFSVGLSSGAAVTIFSTFIAVLLAFLWVFDVNCTAVGNCGIFSWIKAVLLCLTAFGIIWASIVSIYRHYNPPAPEAPEAPKTETEKTTTTTVTAVKTAA